MNKFITILIIICVIAIGVSMWLPRALADRFGPTLADGTPGFARGHISSAGPGMPSGGSFRNVAPGPGGLVRGTPFTPEGPAPVRTEKTPEEKEKDRKLMEESEKHRRKWEEESRKRIEEANIKSGMEIPEKYFTLPSYPDSKGRTAYIRRLASTGRLPHAGGTVRLGTYPQKTETPEPIEWEIVERFSDDTVMVISKYVLECVPFHDGDGMPANWTECSLRRWLNSEFFNTAFSGDDKQRILTADVRDVPATSRSAEFLKDKVFLLCDDEVMAIYPDIVERRRCVATRHARDAGVITDKKTGYGCWFISGTRVSLGEGVDPKGWTGPMDQSQFGLRYAGVRPAMWIKLK